MSNASFFITLLSYVENKNRSPWKGCAALNQPRRISTLLTDECLLRCEGDVVEAEAEAGAGCVLAGDGEFEGLRTGRCECEISKIHGRECAGRIGIFVADGANVCAVDADLEHAA